MLVYTAEDKAIFDDYANKFSERKNEPINELVMETGFYFLETPYVSYTLEVAKPAEKLIINLRELDCTTFTETCLALARTIKSENISLHTYAEELQKIRYRNGILHEFPSRLHYFSDWIYDNDSLGIVQNVTRTQYNGDVFPVRFTIMTRQSKNYPQLADTTFLRQINTIENEISQRTYYYLPKPRLDSVQIQDGDIIAMTVSGKGLDVMHMGIAVNINGQLYFMHASSTGKRVMITDLPFKEYSAAIKSNTGYMIARPKYN
ncbi:xylanase [Bacteroidia bacterium]|nr:xylanase [Bacteroidia bacterium]